MKHSAAAIVAILSFSSPAHAERRPIAELTPTTTIHLGKAADWVAITSDAVWVGSKEPNAVNEIDPRSNALRRAVALPGDPCAGLAVGFGSLWVPLCATPNVLVRVDLKTGTVQSLPGIGPADREGGITTSPDSVWLIVDKDATLARIDPHSGEIRQRIHVPPGSYNPLYSHGQIFVTRADGAEVTVVNAVSGAIVTSVSTGPKPRFLSSGGGAVFTLNQGDGTLTRIDAHTHRVTATAALDTPGAGGDIKYAGGRVYTTFAKIPLSIIDAASGRLDCQWSGPGGDSLDIGYGAIWLTDYDAGSVLRLELRDVLKHCGRDATSHPLSRTDPHSGTDR